MILSVNDHDIINILNNNKELIIVLGIGHDCGLCHAAEFRINDQYAKKYPNINIYNIDITNNPLFRGTHIVFSTPTLLIFKDGKEIFREAGFIKWRNLDLFLETYYEE
ncbi:MAG: thioredoxin family protein [Acholeplasmataceae bacterium]|jgi:thiol-disulfide isomerase/thioredoxin